MTTHNIVTRGQWLEGRRDLIAPEKDLTQRSDQVARLRQNLPWVHVDRDYVFDAPKGRRTLADLFEVRRQLPVQHFMFAPGWEQLPELLLQGPPCRRHDFLPRPSRRQLGGAPGSIAFGPPNAKLPESITGFRHPTYLLRHPSLAGVEEPNARLQLQARTPRSRRID